MCLRLAAPVLCPCFPGELQSAGRQCEAWERERVPGYVQRMEESLQNDMITVDSYAEQKVKTKRSCAASVCCFGLYLSVFKG